MVHDSADVPEGPANLDSVQVRFDEQQLVSNAGLLVTATLAERSGIEESVNESVWLAPRCSEWVLLRARHGDDARRVPAEVSQPRRTSAPRDARAHRTFSSNRRLCRRFVRRWESGNGGC
jgi:hypothetical protein